MGKVLIPVAEGIARDVTGERVASAWSGRSVQVTGQVYWDRPKELRFIAACKMDLAARETYEQKFQVRYFQLTDVEVSAWMAANRYKWPVARPPGQKCGLSVEGN